MKLTEAHIRTAKPKEKPYKLRDGQGLYLLVTSSGSKLWRMRYRHGGRESMIGLGAYPDVSLKKARLKCADVRRGLADGVDPAAKRRTDHALQANTFEAVAVEWLAMQTKHLSERTRTMMKVRLEQFLFPFIGSRPISAVTQEELFAALRRIENRDRHETAHRVRALASRVFRFAGVHDVAADLIGRLAPVRSKNFAALTDPKRVGELLRAIDGYGGHVVTGYALKLAPLVFVRPGELRAAEWSEFDLDAAEWRIPATRMKMDEQHIVPLARQAVAILRDLQAITGRGRYLFPSLRTATRPMSDNTLNAALRRLGYDKTEQTAHGFRTIASTMLNEQDFPPDVIERQLAHAERNKVRAAYNRAERLADRRQMMQAWADYLDSLKAGANVVPLRRRHGR